jgi:myo-inositol 2-dehydrogenase / D-chiro-inositol 1-dehydrogenase
MPWPGQGNASTPTHTYTPHPYKLMPHPTQLESLLSYTQSHPQNRLMVGFTRRFDASYASALSHIQTANLGRPLMLRFQSCEKLDHSPFMHNYVRTCGGIFTDSVIHDVDLALMFLGGSKDAPSNSSETDAGRGSEGNMPRAAVAFGSASAFPELRSAAQHAGLKGDADNAVGMVQFASGAVAWFYNSRTAAAGYDNASEIFCERGKISVNLVARKDRVEVSDERGVNVECVPGWYERYEEAFVEELRHFVERVGDRGEFRVKMADVSVGMRIARALQDSLESGGRVVRFDRLGERVGDGVNVAKL